ncbi:MAG: arylsulfatase [Bacteroidota bacterium]
MKNSATPLMVVLMSLLCYSSCQPDPQKEASTGLPNIVFIFADDLGYGDLPCYNPDSKIPTTHIDGLARAGMRFTDAHAPAAVCVPSRYSLLTGQYPFRNTRKYQEGLIAPGQATMASVLKSAGYTTGMVGKWHQGVVGEKDPPADTDLVGGPTDHGFDTYFGIPASLDIPPYYYIRGKRPTELPSGTIEDREGTAPAPGQRKIQGPFFRGGKISPDYVHEDVLGRFGQEAQDFVKQQAGKTTPFFLYLALPSPHTPWLPDAAHQGKSGAGDYGDFTLQVDDLVGDVLASLESAGKADNTLVIFASDNGPVWYPENVKEFTHSSTTPLAGMKGDAWEAGNRLPFIARWPGKIVPGTTNPNLICFTDMIATFAEVSGTAIPGGGGEDSKSILPMFLDVNHGPIRESLVVRSSGGTFAMRQGDWKLVFGKGSGGFYDGYDPTIAAANPHAGQLYNLREDISESNNLYGEQTDKVKALTEAWKQIVGEEIAEVLQKHDLPD